MKRLKHLRIYYNIIIIILKNSGFCKKERVNINEEKMEEFNNQANEMDLDVLIGCLEELDRVYTHHKANLLISSIDALLKTQRFDDAFKKLFDEFKKRSSLDNNEVLYYFEYSTRESEINVFIIIVL